MEGDEEYPRSLPEQEREMGYLIFSVALSQSQ
jgi:hypothetical protein